jgi:D-sedoheptulose 7-phosphate isomerase
MLLAEAVRKARRVYLCGNGGSAANAIHIANDLIACGIKAHALTADVATLTAIANDFSYGAVFSRQILTFGEPGDLLIALSGSGKSPNIQLALDAAKHMGMMTWAVFGAYNSDTCADLADHVTIAGVDMQDAEEQQLVLCHEVMKQIKKEKACALPN